MRQNVGPRGQAHGRPTEREKYFKEQQDRLKKFGKPGSSSSLDPAKLVDSVFGSSTSARQLPQKQTGELFKFRALLIKKCCLEFILQLNSVFYL